MARKSVKLTRKSLRKAAQETKVAVDKRSSSEDGTFFDKLQYDLQHNQSYLNLILGGLIIVVLGVLLYNYFTKKDTDNLGPSQRTNVQTQGDVSKENLPGKYTVKEGDTLFTISQKYYDNGEMYNLIVAANSLVNENAISVGQVLEIPKPQGSIPSAAPQESASPSASPTSSPEALLQPSLTPADEKGAGGAENQTVWGDKITSDTYTVQPDDWLSKIASRAYGDVFAYQKIAQANNLQNPDSIEIGMVLKIPR